MPRTGQVISHWHFPMDDFNVSPQVFYQAVEASLKRRQIPEIEFKRVEHHEGGFASAKRQYLRVSQKRLAFDICAAPYGTGFFFSWWLTKLPPKYAILVWIIILVLVPALGCLGMFAMMFLLFIALPLLPLILTVLGVAIHQGWLGDEEWVLDIPVLGRLYEILFRPVTYYKIDTTLMFQSFVASAVNEVIDAVRTQKGIRALQPFEKQVTIRGIDK